VDQEYWMKSKPFIIIIGLAVGLILLTGACSAGFIAGRAFDVSSSGLSAWAPDLLGKPAATEVQPGQAGTPDELTGLFAPFWQTWNTVLEFYVDQPVDQEAMMRGAIRGMLESLGDQHTSYMDPEMFQRANAELEGEEYEGIGAWVDTTKDYLTVISPMPGSPAEKAGLKPNDKIIAVDGDDMTGIDGELVRQRVVGPKGSTVILTIAREDQEPFDVEIQRASILVPTVEGKMLENDIAYVRLFTFGDDTAKELRKQLKDLIAQNPKGLILDLRYNGGGYLNTAIDVVSEFVKEGVVMYEQYGDGRLVTYESNGDGLATEIPMVVLVNQGSASASEIVAGAIQDLGRGALVGVTTFGKGSVQNYLPLENEQGAIRVTVARWLTPNKRQIHEQGLTPDVWADLTEENVAANVDAQLDKAIEVILAGLPLQIEPGYFPPVPTPTPTPVP
jgi:carboxyl-terminal processing protease